MFGKPGIELDFERLTVGGHSFGGITALKVGKVNKEVKSCIVYDPWFMVEREKILKESPAAFTFAKNDPPTLIVNTESYSEFCDFKLQQSFG